MIDKSIRQHYDVPETKKIKGQLHKLAYITPKEAKLLQKSGGQKVMTPEGVPAYPPQGRSAQHGGKSSSTSGGKTSTGSGNTGASHDRGGQQHQKAAAPKAAAPKDEPDRRSIALANQYVAPTLTVEPKKSEDDVKQSVIDIGFQEALKKEKIAEDLKKELDKDFLFQDAKAKAPTTLEPKTVTYDRGNPFTKRLIPTTVGQTLFDPRTSQNALLKRPGGIGSFFKNAAMAVVPGLLPAKLAQGYRLAKLGYDLKNRKGVYGTALRLGENLIGKNVGDFIKTGGSQFDRLNPNEMKNVRTFKPTRDRDEERVKTVAERVTTGAGLESGEKLLGVQNTQKAELFKRRRTVENILREGSYQGKDLTSGQRNTLRNYIEQIDKFLVPVQQGI